MFNAVLMICLGLDTKKHFYYTQENITIWLKIHDLVATNTAGDVPEVSYVTTNSAVEVSIKISHGVTLTNDLAAFSPVTPPPPDLTVRS